MSFAKVMKVESVSDHPTLENLGIYYLEGLVDDVPDNDGRKIPVISMRIDFLKHRYHPGEYVLYCSTNCIIPEYMLRQGFWNDEKNKGCLSGNKGNRVSPRRFGGIYGFGIMFPTYTQYDEFGFIQDVYVTNDENKFKFITENELNQDISEFLGITEYVPKQGGSQFMKAMRDSNTVWVTTENVKSGIINENFIMTGNKNEKSK